MRSLTPLRKIVSRQLREIGRQLWVWEASRRDAPFVPQGVVARAAYLPKQLLLRERDGLVQVAGRIDVELVRADDVLFVHVDYVVVCVYVRVSRDGTGVREAACRRSRVMDRRMRARTIVEVPEVHRLDGAGVNNLPICLALDRDEDLEERKRACQNHAGGREASGAWGRWVSGKKRAGSNSTGGGYQSACVTPA
jgi:hypothetical protein